HDSLRSGFKVHDGAVLGFTVAEPSLDWREHDFLGLSPAAAMLACRKDMEAECLRPFSLDRPPLFRARLYRLEAGRQLLFLSAHHAVVDGWSFRLIWD